MGGAMASPALLAPTVTALVPVAANVTLGPPDGAVKVTLRPAAFVTGQPSAAPSDTARLVWKAVPRRALWGVPAASVIVSGGLKVGHDGAPAAPATWAGASTAAVAIMAMASVRVITPSSGRRSGRVGRRARPAGSRPPRRWRGRRRARRPSRAPAP